MYLFLYFCSEIRMFLTVISSALQALALYCLNILIFRLQEGIIYFCSSKQKLNSLKLYLPRTMSLSNQRFL